MKVIKKNFFYNIIYELIYLFIPLVTVPYLTRVLGATGLGQYTFSYTVAFYFSIFIILGLNTYGNRTVAQNREHRADLSRVFCELFVLQLFAGALISCMYVIYASISKSALTWILTIFVISNAFDINWFFAGLEEFKKIVCRNLLVKFITLIIIVSLVKSQNDLKIYCWIMAVSAMSSQLILWPYLPKYVSPVKIQLKDVFNHFKPNIILFTPLLAVSLYKGMDKLMLGFYHFEDHVGYYEASEKVISLSIIFATSLGNVMLPRMSNLAKKGSDCNSLDTMKKSYEMSFFFTSAVCFGTMGVADVFVPLYYGADFISCVDLYHILLPCSLFLAFNSIIKTQYLIPQLKDMIYVKSVIIGAIVNLVINIVLIPNYKSFGASIGTLFTEAIVCIYMSLAVRNELPITDFLKRIWFFLVAGLIMYLIIRNLHFYNVGKIIELVIRIVAGAIIYMLLCIIYFIYKRRLVYGPRSSTG